MSGREPNFFKQWKNWERPTRTESSLGIPDEYAVSPGLLPFSPSPRGSMVLADTSTASLWSANVIPSSVTMRPYSHVSDFRSTPNLAIASQTIYNVSVSLSQISLTSTDQLRPPHDFSSEESLSGGFSLSSLAATGSTALEIPTILTPELPTILTPELPTILTPELPTDAMTPNIYTLDIPAPNLTADSLHSVDIQTAVMEIEIVEPQTAEIPTNNTLTLTFASLDSVNISVMQTDEIEIVDLQTAEIQTINILEGRKRATGNAIQKLECVLPSFQDRRNFWRKRESEAKISSTYRGPNAPYVGLGIAHKYPKIDTLKHHYSTDKLPDSQTQEKTSSTYCGTKVVHVGASIQSLTEIQTNDVELEAVEPHSVDARTAFFATVEDAALQTTEIITVETQPQESETCTATTCQVHGLCSTFNTLLFLCIVISFLFMAIYCYMVPPQTLSQLFQNCSQIDLILGTFHWCNGTLMVQF